MPKFSIVTPTYNRADGRLQRCLSSVWAQTCGDYEHILVDDGSTDGTRELRHHVHNYVRLEHGGRVIARNAGMKAARGEWVGWLDSDDALDPMYLATFAYHIEQEPEADLWVCGAVSHGVKKEGKTLTVPVWTKLRHAWTPPPDESGQWVHAHFPSGRVGTGMFVFRRECLETTGYLPGWKDHLEIADGVDGWLGYQTGYSAAERWVGNPNGEDYCLFRKLTMFYRSHQIDACLYIHYVR